MAGFIGWEAELVEMFSKRRVGIPVNMKWNQQVNSWLLKDNHCNFFIAWFQSPEKGDILHAQLIGREKKHKENWKKEKGGERNCLVTYFWYCELYLFNKFIGYPSHTHDMNFWISMYLIDWVCPDSWQLTPLKKLK